MDELPLQDELWPRAAALWDRACAAACVDPDDSRLVAGSTLPVCEPDFFGIVGAPDGANGIRWLAEAHLASVPRDVRSQHGRFYTPRGLADVLARQALAGHLPEEGLIVDPACGAGSLLTSVIEFIAERNEPCRAVELVKARVRGTDLDATAAILCDLAVRVALLPTWAAIADDERPSLTTFADAADGLADVTPAAVVIANPPFGRCRLSADRRVAHSEVLYGHAHWPTLFLHAAVSRLAPGGRAAFVLPASLVGGAYYQRLREYLLGSAPPVWLGFVDERTGVFLGDVLQEALLGVFVRSAACEDVDIERIDGSLSRPTQSHSASTASWTGRRPWLIPRKPNDVDLIATATTTAHRLRDFGWRVSTGPLVWNRHRAQLFDEWRDGRVPVIWASDVRDGAVVVDNNRQRRYIDLLASQPWLVLDRPAILIQRTTAPEQSRRIVAAFLDARTLSSLGGRVVVENHLNVCTWNGTGPLFPERLLAYFESEDADRLYRCMTGSVAVSAFELGELPIPVPDGLESSQSLRDAA